MKKTEGIKYLGWSNIIICNEKSGYLAFDPFYRPFAGANWATLDDFNKIKIICISHGHSEHYLDVPKVINKTGALVISSKDVCNHLSFWHKIPKEKLKIIEPFEEIEINGYKITAFPWRHRKINYMRFFMGNLFTGIYFTFNSLFRAPFYAPYYGFFIETPEGNRIMNYTEGLNVLMPDEDPLNFGEKFKPDILIGGMQLEYEKDVARAVAAINPKHFIMYHPHEKMFESMKIKSTPEEIVLSHVRKAAPDVKIILPKVKDYMSLPL